MALIVNTNQAATNSQRHLGINNSLLGKSLEKLSSGLRINKAADDAAGLAIATKFNAQVRGLTQAVRNANNAISLVQTAEGGINNLTNILQRLRELAVQASSDDNTSTDRSMMTSEASNLIQEFTRVANTTEFNTMALLDGSFTGRYFQIGANYNQMITFTIGDARGKSLGGRAELDSDIADGMTKATNANFATAELKINGSDVAATIATDDQYSVLTVASNGIAHTSTAVFSGNSVHFQINGTSVDFDGFTWSNFSTNVSMANAVVSAVNSATISNVTARTYDGSKWLLEATNGKALSLAVSLGTNSALDALSAFGMTNTQSMFASGITGATAVANYNGESSAIAKAVAINAIKTTTNVSATAKANAVTGSSAIAAGSIASGDVYINGTNIGTVTVTAGDSTGALVTAINSKTDDTGVTASKDSSGKLVLSASDGRNISVSVRNDTIRGYLNLDSTYFTNNTAIFRSTVRLNSEDDIALTGVLEDLLDRGAGAANDILKSTLTTYNQSADVATFNVAAIEVDTQDNAQAAILTIDAALNDVNLLRSQIGAIQNRLEFTVSNLEIAAENFGASESRIRDADFAIETARFTRNQILTQAGTAMLAQANQLPQIALQLLK